MEKTELAQESIDAPISTQTTTTPPESSKPTEALINASASLDPSSQSPPEPTANPSEESKTPTPSESDLKAQEEAKIKAEARYTSLLSNAMSYKADGNSLFKAGDYQKAKSKYTRVFSYTKCLISSSSQGEDSGMVNMAMASQAEVSEELKQQATELERDVYNNMSIIFLKEKNWSKAIEKATLSLKVEKNAKAYFNRGKAFALKNDFDSAYKDLEQGKKEFEDQAKLFEGEIERVKKLEKNYDKETSKKYAGFFSQVLQQDLSGSKGL